MKGKLITPFKYDYTGFEDVYVVKGFINGLLRVAIGGEQNKKEPGWGGGKWGFINKIGKEIIPIKYQYAQNFSDGLAAVMLNKKWGFVDSNGKLVIPLKYDLVHESFSNGKAVVSIDGGSAITIYKKGNVH